MHAKSGDLGELSIGQDVARHAGGDHVSKAFEPTLGHEERPRGIACRERTTDHLLALGDEQAPSRFEKLAEVDVAQAAVVVKPWIVYGFEPLDQEISHRHHDASVPHRPQTPETRMGA